jgi:hypothetical protein
MSAATALRIHASHHCSRSIFIVCFQEMGLAPGEPSEPFTTDRFPVDQGRRESLLVFGDVSIAAIENDSV